MAGKKLKPLDPAAAAESAQLAESYYDGMRQAKVTAGLSLADAIEVTARQRNEDEANGLTPWVAEPEPEEIPEA